MRDPKVIDPPGFDVSAAWGEHKQAVDDCGGMTYDDGEVNWRAAFSADPGGCECPRCEADYWAFGHVIECLDCGLRFETRWWGMWSWGVQASIRGPVRSAHELRMESAAYREGFENPPKETSGLYEQRLNVDWEKVFSSIQPA